MALHAGMFGAVRRGDGDPAVRESGTLGRSQWRAVRLRRGELPCRAFRCRTGAAFPIPSPTTPSRRFRRRRRKPKAQPKVKAPEPDAIPLKSRNAKQQRHASRRPRRTNGRTSRQYKPNQVYTTGGQAASSPVYNQPGGGGVGFGNNSPFGTQFGWYANLLREKIASAWRTAEVSARRKRARVIVQFTMRRDGSLAPGLPRIVQSSGDGNLDRSAQRAILDAAPFPPLPPQLNGNEVNVELTFQLRR